MKIVITGGHHTSALPVINELKNKHSGDQIFWVGHKYSLHSDKNPTLEYIEITELGVPFYDLKAGKVYKSKNPLRLLKVPLGVVQAFYFLLKLKPDVILSFGGYLAAPVVLAGWVLGIPSITHEQTVVTGHANKFIANFAKKILLTWKDSEKLFKNKKTIVVGLPLRKEIFTVNSNNFKTNPDLPTVYITAGKTGSHLINIAVLAALPDLLNICNVIHQCGDHSEFNDHDLLLAEYKQIMSAGIYNVRKFVLAEEIGEAFSKADLVVGRSGAHTIYELLALEKPAVLIPIPWVSHNEQFENASLLYKSGLARILEQKDLNAKTLLNSIKLGLSNLEHMKITKPEIKNALVLNSAELIVNELYN